MAILNLQDLNTVTQTKATQDSITPDDLIINPNAPPAPVISNISKEFFREFAIHFKIFLESSFFINAIEIIRPISSAISGLPIKLIKFVSSFSVILNEGYFNNVETDIKTIGIMIGRKEEICFSLLSL